MMQPTVVISLDLELAWGAFDHAHGDALLRMARWTHDVGVPNLLGHLTSNGLSATWALVGGMMRSRLLDTSCLPEVHYSHFPKPWFHYVPKDGDESMYPEWFGASLVDSIRRAEPKQEIGFHSFSHVLFGWPGMTRERAIAEFEACADNARELRFPARAFVFPRNSVGFLEELRAAGFTCFRDVDAVPLRSLGKKAASVGAVLADFAGLEPAIVQPSLKHGLVAIPGSLMVRYAEGWRKYIPDASRLRRLQKGLAKVRRTGGIFHVWFHPENLYAEWPRLERIVAAFFRELGEAVRSGDVRCLTMGEVAEEALATDASAATKTQATA